MDKLNTQIDALEAEQEQLHASMKKQKRQDPNKAQRMGQIDHRLERHKFHINKIELILRLLDNNSLTADQVSSVKESVNYYIDENMEDPDFEDDDEIYTDLNLEDADGFGPIHDEKESESEPEGFDPCNLAPPPKHEKKPSVDNTESTKKTLSKAKTKVKAAAPSPSPARAAPVPSTPATPIKEAAQPAPLPVRYAAAAATSIADKVEQKKKVKESSPVLTQSEPPVLPPAVKSPLKRPDPSPTPQQPILTAAISPNSSQQSSLNLPQTHLLPVADVILNDNQLPASVGDLVKSFEAARERCLYPSN